MHFKFNTKAYREREIYIGLFSILLGSIMLFAPDRNEDLYLIYPKVVFVGLIGIGAIMFLFALFVKAGDNIAKSKVEPIEILLLLILMSSRFLIGTLGLYSTVFIVTFLISIIVQKDKSIKSLLKTLLFNIVLIVVLYAAFAVLLKVNAPDAWLI